MAEYRKELRRGPESKGFLHGGDLESAAEKSGRSLSEILDFSANINPLGMPSVIRKAAADSLNQAVCYPDPFCRRLRAALAEYTGWKADYILCGNGGADLIYRLVYALYPEKALVTAPAFAEYEEALGAVGTEIVYHKLDDSDGLTESIVEKMTQDLNLMFLCNPNNPTGLLTEKSLLMKILKKSQEQDIWVCMDECFLEFVPDPQKYSVSDLLEEYPKLVILKSFTKLYAMPGLRLGYVLSSNTLLLERMRKAGQPWSVSEPAQAAGIAALEAEKEGFREKTVEYVTQERIWLKEGLIKLGFSVMDGQANYLCFRAPGDENLRERLLGEGLLLRSCANYRGLGKDYYRTAVRTRKENERLLEALGKVCGKNE